MSNVEAVNALELEDGDVILSEGQRAIVKMMRDGIFVCRGTMAMPLTQDAVLREVRGES